ncbi:DUF6279 family lipoprotein [Roseateles sp. GG27B]
MPKIKNALRHASAGLTALLLLVVLQGCTLVKLSYNQADTLLYWRLDSYTDFTREQAPRVKEGLAQFHEWHRRTQLPVYADLLRDIRPSLAEPLSAEQACAVFDQLRHALDSTLDPTHWTLLGLTGELSDEQLRHLERKQAIGDAEWKKEWISVSPEQLLKTRFEQALSRSEMLYGRLDEPQKDALRATLSPTSFEPQRNYAERLRREQDLRQVLRKIRDEKLGPEAARTQLKRFMDRALASPNPAYRRYMETQISEGCNTFASLHNATTPTQRAKAVRTVEGYERDFRQLAGQLE